MKDSPYLRTILSLVENMYHYQPYWRDTDELLRHFPPFPLFHLIFYISSEIYNVENITV